MGKEMEDSVFGNIEAQARELLFACEIYMNNAY